jgi:hypothetical protein
MIGLLVLTVPMLPILVYGLLELKRSRVIGTAISLLTFAALAFIWIPGVATTVANALQLGSAADLVTDSWIGLVTLILLNLHLRMRRHMQTVTALTRGIAIGTGQTPENLPGPSISRS